MAVSGMGANARCSNSLLPGQSSGALKFCEMLSATVLHRKNLCAINGVFSASRLNLKRSKPCKSHISLDKMNDFVESDRRRCRSEGLWQYARSPTVLLRPAAWKDALATVDVIATCKSADPGRHPGSYHVSVSALAKMHSPRSANFRWVKAWGSRPSRRPAPVLACRYTPGRSSICHFER